MHYIIEHSTNLSTIILNNFTIGRMDLSYHRVQHRFIELRQRYVRWRHYSLLVQIDTLDYKLRLRVQTSLGVAYAQMLRQL